MFFSFLVRNLKWNPPSVMRDRLTVSPVPLLYSVVCECVSVTTGSRGVAAGGDVQDRGTGRGVVLE